MGIFGKRKQAASPAAPMPAPGEGIRDLAAQPPPPDMGQEMSADLGPPSPEAAAAAPAPPPPPPAPLTEEEEMMGGPAGIPAAPPPYPPMAAAAAPAPPPVFGVPGLGPADMAMAAPVPTVQAAGGLERLDSVEQRMSDMSRRVDLLDKASDDIRNDISRIRDSIAQIEGDMRELTSLYDLISTQINPFIDTSTMEERPALAVEQGAIPDFDALFEPTPELAAERPGEAAVEAAPAGAVEALPEEAKEGEEIPSRKTPRLAKIGADASCHLALMEWIRFMLERVHRSEVFSLLSFYQRIGWISAEVKADVLEIIRGIGPVAGEPAPPPLGAAAPASLAAAKDAAGDIVIAYKKEEARDLRGPAKGAPAAAKGAPAAAAAAAPSPTWRLTPDDHIGSLMYIEWIRSGGDLDRDKLEEIRREVSRLRSGLDGFFSL